VGTTPTYVDTKGIGLVFGQRNLTLGWLKEQTVLFPDPSRCAVFIIATSVKDVKAIVKFLKETNHNLSNICISEGQRTI
jgi:hypothetical protein